MKFGFVGSGNMARSMAIGFGEAALFCDSGSGRAAKLAAETGGQAVTLVELAESVDVVFLSHKPKQLADVAAELSGFDRTIVSLLAATPLGALREAYPAARIVRTMPNIPVEEGQGVLGVAEGSDAVPELDPYFARLGLVVRCDESQFELLTAIGGCAPAFFALFSDNLIASASERGMDEATARAIVNQTMLGTATTLAATDVDTQALMRRVASPGGLTERALESFGESGLKAAVDAAVATVLGE